MSQSCFKTFSMAPQCSMTKTQAPDYHLLSSPALLLGALLASLLISNHSPYLHQRTFFQFLMYAMPFLESRLKFILLSAPRMLFPLSTPLAG